MIKRIYGSLLLVIFLSIVATVNGEIKGDYWSTDKNFKLEAYMDSSKDLINLFQLFSVTSPIKRSKSSALIIEGIFPGHDARGLSGDRPLVFSLIINDKKMKDVTIHNSEFQGDHFEKDFSLDKLGAPDEMNSFIVRLIQGNATISKVVFLK
jgi:hypothetical protein